MKRLIKRHKAALVLSLRAAVAVIPRPATAQQSASDSTPIEQGKFTLHKFEQPIGQEAYEIRREGDSLAVKIDFKFTDRGSPVPLTTTFRSASDLTPQAFEIKGQTARPVSIDEALTIDRSTVHFRTRDKKSDISTPSGPFFTIAGYAPTTMQMLMVRYWATHGSPAQLATLPSGTVRIEARGQDTIHVVSKEAIKEAGKDSANGGANEVARDEKLDRYTVEGLIWGRETLWFDAN